MIKQKSIILFGTYAEQNLGDDLMLMSQIIQLKNRIPNVKLIIYTGDCELTETMLKNENISFENIEIIYTGRKGLKEPGKPFLKSFSWFFKNIKAVFTSDLLIIGPGNQTQDVTRKMRFLFFLSRCLLATLFKTPYAFMGIGYYQIKNRILKAMFKYLGNHSAFISTRDAGGGEKILKLLTNKEKVHPLADVSFTYKWQTLEKKENTKLKIGFTSRIFLKEVFKEDISKNFEKCYGELLNVISEKYDAEFIFFPFYKTKPWDDTVSLDRLVKNSGNNHLNIKISSFKNITELSNDISQLDAMIGVRYHSVLISVQHKVPSMGISYAHKTQRFMCENGLEDYVVNLENIKDETLPEMFNNLIKNRKLLKEKYKEIIEREQKLALQNFELIEKTINK